MAREQIDKLWADKTNWKWGVIYSCPEDPRTIVPRRWRWGGWTLNFGHTRAGLTGLLAFGLAVGPGLLTLLLFGDHNAALFVLIVSIVVLIRWAHLESSRVN